jgi:hypothetical protein
MMMKGPFRELIPVDLEVSIPVPEGFIKDGINLLVRNRKPVYKINEGRIIISVPQVSDHEIVALDMK